MSLQWRVLLQEYGFTVSKTAGAERHRERSEVRQGATLHPVIVLFSDSP